MHEFISFRQVHKDSRLFFFLKFSSSHYIKFCFLLTSRGCQSAVAAYSCNSCLFQTCQLLDFSGPEVRLDANLVVFKRINLVERNAWKDLSILQCCIEKFSLD